MSREIFLLTENSSKIMSARQALEPFGINIEPIKPIFPEIQAKTSSEAARFAVTTSIALLGLPVIREDHSFHIEALNGFPGPYLSDIEEMIDEEKLLRIMNDEKNRNSQFTLALAYLDKNGRYLDFTSSIPTNIGIEARGSYSDGWHRVIHLQGEEKTLAEQPFEKRMHLYMQNFVLLAQALLSVDED